MLAHLLTALMILPLAAGYAALRARGSGAGWRGVAGVAAGAAAGAGLSAFYWLPALLERWALADPSAFTSGYYDLAVHFVRPRQWLDPAWGFGAASRGLEDGMSVQVGLLTVAAVAASLAALPAMERGARRFVLLAAALGAAALWLTTAASRPWYDLLAPYRMIQFPWRFLGPASLFLAGVAGGGVHALSRRLGARAGAAGIAAVAALALWATAGMRTVSGRFPVPEGPEVEAAAVEGGAIGKLAEAGEHLPRWASPERAERPFAGPEVIAPGARVEGIAAGAGRIRFTASAASAVPAIVPWHYFPGWRAEVDGAAVPVEPGPDGFLLVRLPPGRHAVEVRMGTTPARLGGWAVAAATLGLLAGAGAREARRRRTDRGRPPPEADGAARPGSAA